MNNRNQRDARRASFGSQHSLKVLGSTLVTLTLDLSDWSEKVRAVEEAPLKMTSLYRSEQHEY